MAKRGCTVEMTFVCRCRLGSNAVVLRVNNTVAAAPTSTQQKTNKTKREGWSRVQTELQLPGATAEGRRSYRGAPPPVGGVRMCSERVL